MTISHYTRNNIREKINIQNITYGGKTETKLYKSKRETR